jgi:uncharacterized protein YbjT (DUF2867 family)
LKWYTRGLEALAQDTSSEVGRFSIANEDDIAEAVRLEQGIDIVVPWDGTFADRVSEVAASISDDIAIKDDQGRTLTYSQMMVRVL